MCSGVKYQGGSGASTGLSVGLEGELVRGKKVCCRRLWLAHDVCWNEARQPRGRRLMGSDWLDEVVSRCKAKCWSTATLRIMNLLRQARDSSNVISIPGYIEEAGCAKRRLEYYVLRPQATPAQPRVSHIACSIQNDEAADGV